MELKDLVGPHYLSGIEHAAIPKNRFEWDTSQDEGILFTLDGIHYLALEDPDDGYRSYLKELVISDRAPRYRFDAQRVVGRISEESGCDKIEFYDANNDQIVLVLGTDNNDDYYPCCIIEWYPQNLSVNLELTDLQLTQGPTE